jgi:indolepyruvate decarboxylase
MGTGTSVADYLIEQLYAGGVHHIFGVPGDYVLGFYDKLSRSKLKVINMSDEQSAGFAADAYARVRGLGAVCVTYCVGGLKVVNATAQAFAEKSPVVVISGAPGINERVKNPLLHHKVREFDTQLKIFEQVTVASAVLSDPRTAVSEIDNILSSALRYKRPVYIELPRDMNNAQIVNTRTSLEVPPKSDPATIKEALAEAVQMINTSNKPVIIAGEEVARFGLQDELERLIDKTNIPVAALILSKSVVRESHPLYLGVYEGAVGQEAVREYVESSDCLIILGAFMTDVNLGVFTAKIDQEHTIYATSEELSIRYHKFEDVLFQDFLHGLLESRVGRRTKGDIPSRQVPKTFSPMQGKRITVKRLFEYLDSFLTEEFIVTADVGDALLAGSDLTIPRGGKFLSPAYYLSLGFAVPASIGAQLANQNLRPLVLVGDGAFQMTGMELGTAARFNLNPIVIVLNNRGYGTERPMLDGEFNDLQEWQYHRVPEVIGKGKSFVVDTEEQLVEALSESRQLGKDVCILEVRLDPHDMSPALERLTSKLGARVRDTSGK